MGELATFLCGMLIGCFTLVLGMILHRDLFGKD